MNILVTGANGFVGRNLISQLHNIQSGKAKNYKMLGKLKVFEYDVNSDPAELEAYCKCADFVFNLAGVNRPKDPAEFVKGNFGFASTLLNTLKKYNNTCPVMISSSTQAAQDNPYGESKRAGENLLFDYSKATGSKVLVYRFPNVFGKWCRPNYNSAIATFCHNITHGLDIQVNDRSVVMNLVYIDDVVNELIAALTGDENRVGEYCAVPTVHTITLGEIVDLLYTFQSSRVNLTVPNVGNAFEKKLYSTYLSYLPTNQFSYPLKMNVDERGSFTEIIRTLDRGQVSVNISKPHITKGNHWHHTKNEKFVVVSGQGVIRFRKMDEPDAEVIEYLVSGSKIEVVDIPIGYTHNIENLGDTDMVTFMWCNECFDPQNPDTFFETV
ncbi:MULTISPECIES: capsular polysaccharide biosynthesis protein CapF [Bacteroides]|jgi:UDP-2-acetamido-2,6-beta-L-arabino-hexul-4-ose reductase|uniref:Capsular biosynthesis protein n=1 Tax=Bacteroides fragilis TaxID=817 RepID=A0A0I9SB33_BACFG|nr:MULTISPECIES: capsular polysaccharide biosynthesis protein CapF [Bacteroides]MCE8566752.1 capsular polysaccharide biosynthesis protein CapF [Bacteroides fragilis]MCM0228192.1 capsular polysaccharide biosynthesis protein CapF [Bacteroides fragilis]MCM0363357.1 capsular polysaccharide biosynthesis protein CapF [Bacteroides fragilis]MDA1488709.1 capsular polysaccharide biosynthesis protein CapF [Bacteroides fragilis]MDY3140974.1 capsular polysaccharide biosynthesis protein CapF [Bacteroides sp